ncbi:MAG: HD domain-containing protein [Planctomycetaceae bacterium]|nr:HD domain-containing protein [Planctomycetaceae bacterium]
MAGVKNTGPAVKEKLVFLGKKGYSQQQRGRLLEGHKENSKALGSMISDAIHGTLSDGAPVAKMAANYLQEMTTDTDNVLTSTIGLFEEEDLATRSIEVSVLSMAIGIEMGLDQENCYRLAITGLVHDWGMMKVPEEIRSAVHKINVIEQLEIHKHPIHSMELLQRVSSLPSVVSVISYQVHERMNGTGYPRGRRGKSIHQLARMLQVADEYVELTSPIRKRRPVMIYKAMEHLIYQAKQNRIDGEVVKALLKVQSLFPLGSYVTLSDGSIAQVLRRNRDHFAEPIVCRVQNSSGHEVAPNDPENIIDLHESQDLKVIQALPTPGSDETDEIPESVMPDGN